MELDESKICTCVAISDNANAAPGEQQQPAAEAPMMADAPAPQHIMPGGGRGVPIA